MCTRLLPTVRISVQSPGAPTRELKTVYNSTARRWLTCTEQQKSMSSLKTNTEDALSRDKATQDLRKSHGLKSESTLDHVQDILRKSFDSGQVWYLQMVTNVDEKLQKHYSYFDQFLRRAKREFEIKLHQDIKQNCSLDDFDLIKTLGSGSFGLVVLCRMFPVFGRDRKNNRPCAIKMMEKYNIIKTRQLAHTGAEIKLMKNLNFPFIIDMHGFFMDNSYVGICMTFANGGDMFTHLRELKKFEESLAKFYGAQVILAFEYLHFLGVVYRDLKPENILLDIQGYLKVTDLGFCKKIDNTRTYTLCGTPEYLAPEIILSQGYNKSVDYWSYGVLIFEMNAGYAPFYAKEPMKLYEKIVSGKYVCPPFFSKPLKDLLSNILIVDRTKRYGLLKNGIKDIKSHEWFKNVDFDQILSKKIIPSYIPKVDNEMDTRYFDSSSTKPLTIKKASKDEYAREFEDIFVTPKT